jgi:tetratricopeptide (TPR) repeat protein
MTVRTVLCRLFRLLAVLALSAQAFAQEPAAGPGSAKPSPPETKLETVAVVSDRAPVKAGDKVVATVEKGRMFGVLSRRGDLVEIQVCVGTQILRGTLAVSHVKFLTDADVDLAAEWLKMSKDLNPKMDVAACRAKLDALIDRVAAAAALGKTPREKARLIGLQLFEREGLSAVEGQKDARADLLLDSKQGNDLTLSLLYLCVGRRLGTPLYLVRAAGHMLVRYDDGRDRFNIETTKGGQLHDSDEYLREQLGAHQFGQVGGVDLASMPLPRAASVVLVSWAGGLTRISRHADACEKYARAVEINPRYTAAYSNWGWALGKMGKPAEACEKFAKAVEINPQDAAPYCGWGAALVQMDKPAEACEKYAKAVEIDPRDAVAYYNWGLALGEMGKHAQACEKYAKAVEINPRFAEACANWGWVLGKMGKDAEACEKYAKAVEINPRDADAYSNWGVALRAMGKAPEACEKYAKAVELNPRDAIAYSNWGLALGTMDKHAEACDKCAKAVEIDPRLAGAFYNWGVALGKMGKDADACEKYARAVELDPRYASAYYNWGVALGKRGKPAEAREKFAKAVEINPGYAHAYANWGIALGKMGKTAEAIEKLDKAAELDPALKPQVEELRKELLGKK